MENLQLVFIRPIYRNNGHYIYDFYFSKTPDDVWGIDWDYNNPSSVEEEEIIPDKTTYHKVERVSLIMPLKTIQETTCYSMEYGIYNIIALAWIDIENMEEYPEVGRLPLYFGEEYEKVMGKIKDIIK
jgi:hypothetical protein